jgi:hypothetical protein
MLVQNLKGDLCLGVVGLLQNLSTLPLNAASVVTAAML